MEKITVKKSTSFIRGIKWKKIRKIFTVISWQAVSIALANGLTRNLVVLILNVALCPVRKENWFGTRRVFYDTKHIIFFIRMALSFCLPVLWIRSRIRWIRN
jgi:hypothetical protein